MGAGGWAYFDVPGEDALRAYARAFPFVEVNATFYEWPDPRTVSRWRRRVPPGFRFSVRAHRDLTHRHRFVATPEARSCFARTAKIADRLDALAIVLETPDAVRPEAEQLRELLSTARLPCPVALEARAYCGRPLPRSLAAAMEEHDVADAVDLSRQSPRTESALAYARLFGPEQGNRWEFTADELTAIGERGDSVGTKRIAYAFHGVRMYKDAGRFLTYVRTGRVPPATRHAGLRSLEEILAEDAHFPATATDLVREHGFRVVALPDREIHARELLGRLPPDRYDAPAAVTEALRGLG